MDERSKSDLFDEIHRLGLLGLTPRHVLDPPLRCESCDDLYLNWCRAALHAASRFADDICERYERQCHELEAIEDAGLSGRVRYLVTIAAYTAAIHEVLNAPQPPSQLAFLRTAHWLAKESHDRATHDMSNLLGALMQAVALSMSRTRILGTWIWLNLGDQDSTRHFLWVKSSLRFMSCYGQAIEEEFLPRARELWEREPWSANPGIHGEVSRKDVLAIAEQYVAESPDDLEGVARVVTWDEITWRKPCLYGFSDGDLEQMWIVYLRRPLTGLRSSQILLIERTTGRIAYAGSANDEG